MPLVLYGFLLSLNLELPDFEVDREHGKKNLVVLAGRRRAAFLIILLSLTAEGYVILFVTELFSRSYVLPLLSAAPIVSGLSVLQSSGNLLQAERKLLLTAFLLTIQVSRPRII